MVHALDRHALDDSDTNEVVTMLDDVTYSSELSVRSDAQAF
jgi:hypothetical protein